MTTDVASQSLEEQKPDGIAWSEFLLLNGENNQEMDLVDEFAEIGAQVTEHILKYLGGQKANKRIIAACRFFNDRDITPSDKEVWLQADHDRRVFMCEERLEVMNLIKILFNQCLHNFHKDENWQHHLRRNFPGEPLSEIIVSFEEDNKRLTRAYQNMINELRQLWGNMLFEMGSDEWAWL